MTPSEHRGAARCAPAEVEPVTAPQHHGIRQSEPTAEHDVSLIPAAAAAELLLELQDTRRQCAQFRAHLQQKRAELHAAVERSHAAREARAVSRTRERR